MAYKVSITGAKNGKATQVFRVKQYTQCNLGNHLTMEIKLVEQFDLRTDAVRNLTQLLADDLTRHNVTILRASNGYAKVLYEYSNGDEIIEYTVTKA